MVVAPFDHTGVPAEAVSITEPPEQNVTGPPAVMVAAGKLFTVAEIVEDAEPQPLLTVTE